MGSMVECAPEGVLMIDMNSRHKRTILLEVYAREADGLRWPTTRELAAMLGRSYVTISRYINDLIDAGLLEREGYALRLTDCARAMLDLEIGA